MRQTLTGYLPPTVFEALNVARFGHNGRDDGYILSVEHAAQPPQRHLLLNIMLES
jgi:hypothetical protein